MTESVRDPAVRPSSFAEFVGQRVAIANIRIAVDAARRAGRALDHLLITGPSGVGKTTVAQLVASEMGARLHVTSAPAIEHKGDLASLLTSLDEGDVLFIDEVHALRTGLQECLYTALEDRRVDMFGRGPNARQITLRLPLFTLVGATTRPALLAAPFRERFGLRVTLHHYDAADMLAIVRRSAKHLKVGIDEGGAAEIARRSRGTPRVANRLLCRTRDYAESCCATEIDRTVAAAALDQLGLDSMGLDTIDRAYLGAICDTFGGGPVGIETIAAALGEERTTLEDVVEPYLLARGLVVRMARGRVATTAGSAHWRGLDEGHHNATAA